MASFNLHRVRPARWVFFGLVVAVLSAGCGDDADDAHQPAPTVTSPVIAASTSAPPPPAMIREEGVVMANGDRRSNAVALTFDMGGRVDPALDIMAFLIDNEVPATIFMTGHAAEHPTIDYGRQTLEMVCANSHLFDLANHSYTHTDFREMTADDMRMELLRTEEAMRPHCDLDPRPIFRPPMGYLDEGVVETVTDSGYPYIILWDIDSLDWRPESEGGPSAKALADRILDNAEGGSIVLFHLGGYNTLEALGRIVPSLREAGFELVNLRQLLGLTADAEIPIETEAPAG